MYVCSILRYSAAKLSNVYPDNAYGTNPPKQILMIELNIPVPDTRYSKILANPNYKITLGDDAMDIVYNYKYQNYIDADNPDLGVSDAIKIMTEEYMVNKMSISMISLIRDDSEEVFTVGVDYCGIYYDVAINFKLLKDAREFRSKLIEWRFKK